MFEKVMEFKDKEIDLFTIGELLVDLISQGYDECDDDLYNKKFGGSPANICMNTKKLGLNSVVSSSVGNDRFGDYLINQLENNKIDTKYIKRSENSTSMVVVTKSKETPIPIFYRGADYDINYNEDIDYLVKNSKIVHFSCWPISQPKSRKTIENIIDVANKNNTLVCFDPNYHIDIWERGHDGIEYIKDIISKVDIIKPSEDDANRIFGEDTPKNQLKKFLDLGPKIVIMTLGKDGAIVGVNDKVLEFETMATEVVDATGAGDAFWSGFYSGIIKGETLNNSISIGFATSAYKLKYLGSICDLPSFDEIKEIYNI